MRINHNIAAMNTYRQYNTNAASTNKSMEKLSSGSRINRAADDAAGLSISEKMRSQIRGLTQAKRNAEDGVSFIQTAEGALNEVSDMLTRIKELSVQVTNGTYSDDDKANIGSEMSALGTAIADIYTNTKFNGIAVFGTQTTDTTTTNANDAAKVLGALDSADTTTYPTAATIYYGEDAKQSISIATATTSALHDLTQLTTMASNGDFLTNVDANGKFVKMTTAGTAGAVTKADNAEKVTTAFVEAAITEVNTTRANYGAQQNQLEHASNNMATTNENLQAAESRVRDVDMAEEMMEYTKDNILLQAAQSMLAQANSQPQGVLQLLQ